MSAEKIMRGTKIRLYPNKRQTEKMDLWRRRTVSLWNLLLSMEQAAYSGENIRPELRWRQIWAEIMTESYQNARHVWEHGKYNKDGKERKAPHTGAEPQPPSDDFLNKIRLAGLDEPPKLLIWEHELQKLMARLKKVPQTRWIADLPSHAAQAVAKDLIKALQSMLRERKKRLSGAGGRNTGFPRFKKSRYAAGSVYLANTQFDFGKDGKHVRLPNGIGNVRVKAGDVPLKDKLMGGRIWREGEDWYLSCQWEVPKPEPLPETERQAGVKIGAAILLTTYDERGQTREYWPPEVDERLARRHKLHGRKLARRLSAHRRKEKKVAARGKNVNGGKVRLRRSKGFIETSADLARLEAHNRNQRDDHLHKLTTGVVQRFGALQVQKMDVAKLMAKPKRTRRKSKAEGAKDTQTRRSFKVVRKMMRHAAMARTREMLAYKAADYGRDYAETDQLEPIVQACRHCGGINPQMKDGRRVTKCVECGERLLRNRNAAGNEQRLLQRRKGNRPLAATETPEGGTGHV